ncbi:helix-turn-helix domain-containing protein [Motiliproteus sp. MSK22-1]|uniref:winged helix-turn-helix transcriptional regulator n=1 Tax=Motiliproteus sp. MSK22-1 TaxID=1897630 RepID=UPI000976F7CE|nr:helix-turn-helix domain-containing protein [Motiliproteus sp. MSK22-1]OMH33657.1 transcriptional regulator [Motiliproteus sp. MSK22-1]
MSIPFPGVAVRGSKTGKPVMALLDLLGRTWSLGILWNLNSQALTFRELQSCCEQISPSLLNTRLKELRALKLIRHQGEGYCLTELGIELFNIIEPMGKWSVSWAEVVNQGDNGGA